MIVKAHIILNAAPTKIWNTITDIRNAAEIIKGIEKIEIINEPAKGLVGLRWLETRMYFGKPATVEKYIIEAVENKFYTSKAEADGFIFETTMSISETESGVTLTSSHDSKPLGIGAKIKSIPMIFFKGMLKKLLLKDLTDINTAVERKG